MKKILLALFVLVGLTSHAKNYYLSASGDDANTGLSPATPWRSIGKINSFTFTAKDSVLFKRGETFYGGIVVKQLTINFGAYGTGAKPVISGLSTVSGWVNLGNNIWEAPTTGVKANNNLVLKNGVIQQVGRYPNANAANKGYLMNTATTASSITGPAVSTTTNWTGAEIAFRTNRWTIDRQIVSSHSGGTVNFPANSNTPRVKFGYFFQRDSRTLDQDGEWWQDGVHNKLRMYFANNNPTVYNIQVATVDTLFINTKSNVTVSDLAFNGSGKAAMVHNGPSGIIVKNCDVTNSGGEALVTWVCTNVTIDNCTTNNSLGAGIKLFGSTSGTVNLTVKNCTVSNTALLAGMEAPGVSGSGINVKGGSNIQVLNNVIRNSGYNGIHWQGDNVNIKYNLVDSFCSVRDDGGGIYTWEATTGSTLPVRTNRNIVSNIIMNGIGASTGTVEDGEFETSVNGVYLDDGTRTVLIDSNTIFNIGTHGVHGNSNSDNTITNNTFFNTQYTFSFQRFAGSQLTRNMTISRNICYPYIFRYRNLGLNTPTPITKEADILAMGVRDSNYYSIKTDTTQTTVTSNADNSNYKEGYYAFSYLTGTVGIEKHSKNVVNTGTLEYNASNIPKVVNFPNLSKKDVYGNVYANSVTIPAWSSKILIPNGAATAPKTLVANAGADQIISLPLNTITLTGAGN